MTKIKSPDELSELGLYANREMFERLHDEGYTEVTFGKGTWKNDFRIVAIFIVFHPEGKVFTYQHPKMRPDGHTGVRGDAFEQVFPTKDEFTEYCTEHGITFYQKNAPMTKVLAEYGIVPA